MPLPFADDAIVPEAKLVDYLLNPSHPRGGPKAHVFLALGFRRESPEALRAALLEVARSAEFVAFEHPHGVKYVGDGDARTPSGAVARLRTVWLMDGGRQPPRFVTAYPAGRPVR